MKKLVLMFALMLSMATAWAIPAKRGVWQTIKLADGTTIRAELRGDEHSHWMQAENGKVYMEMNGNGVYTEVVEAEAMAKGNARRATVQARRSARFSKIRREGGFTGEKKALVILVQFADMSFQESNDKSRYERVINEVGFSDGQFRGSVRDYFLSQSEGVFDLDFDIVGPVTLANNYAYYGENNTYGDDMRPGAMVSEALLLADNDVDFTKYDWDGDGEVDQVYFLYAGRGEADGGNKNTIWPHEWQLSETDYKNKMELDGVFIDTYACGNEINGYGNMAGIGTMCHEFSHCLGFPDTYDIAYQGHVGMGSWDLMCSGGYNGDGYCPAGYTAYERMVCGWKEPIELVNDTIVSDMKAINNGGESYIIYNKAYPDEYYLLENRNRTNWDAELPGRGLLITYVDYDKDIWDYNIVNCTRHYAGYPYNDHERLTVINADNHRDDNYQAGDPYPYAANDSLTNKSKPAATLYHPNTDGKKFMNVGILNIKRANDGTVSFTFRGTTPSETPGGQRPENAIFYESFDQCIGNGGNDNVWSGSTTAAASFLPDNEGWEAQSKAGANKCAKFGSAAKLGVVTTPEFTIDGETTFSFKAAPWGNDNTELAMSIEGDATIEPANFTMENEMWSTFTATIKGNGPVRITFTPSKRIFLDEVAAVPAGEINSILLNEYTEKPVDLRIYSIDGRYVGNNLQLLGRGIYIMNGKKIVK